MKTVFKVTKVTDERNEHNMPKVLVESSTEITVYKVGQNHFECEQNIDETDLLQLRDKLPDERWAFLVITTPTREINCSYFLKSKDLAHNIVW